MGISEYETNREQMTKEFEEQKLKIQENAKSQVKNVEAQVFALQCKLKEIQKANSIQTRSGSDSNAMSIEDAEKMSKEMVAMDRIIENLNKENAKLLKQIKSQKIDLRQSQQIMFNENQKINHDLISTQHQLTEMQQTKIEELQPLAFSEIQKLRKQLQEIEDTQRCRERELGSEIFKLKEENRDLQFKLSGIDKKRFDDESDIIQEFKKEALKIQKKSQNEITELQRKLKWYIENQELIENLNEKIKQQNSEILSLKTSPSSSSTSSPTKKKKKIHKKPTINEHRKIVTLKKKVKDLEKMLSSKHPDSIANLLSMMNGEKNEEDEEEQDLIVRQLREQIVLLQENLDNKEDEILSRLRALRQQHDKVQLRLNNKIKSLQQQITKSKREKGFIRPSAKIKELNEQIEALKVTHNKKIKLLKDKHLAQIKNMNNDKNNKFKNISNHQDNNQQIIELQNDLECKLNEIEALNLKLTQKQSMIENLQLTIDTKNQSHKDLKTQISLLQIQLKTAIKQHENMTMIKKKMNESPPKEIEIEKEKEKVKEVFIMNEEKERMYMEKIRMMEQEITDYKRECQVLHEKISLEKSKGEQSLKAMQNKMEWNKLEQQKTEQLITKLQFELNHAKNTPSYVEYETLLIKLEKIEKRGSERERELEQSYMRLLQSNDDVEDKLNHKYQAIIADKDTQIRLLQNELSVLMTALNKIQSNSA